MTNAFVRNALLLRYSYQFITLYIYFCLDVFIHRKVQSNTPSSHAMEDVIEYNFSTEPSWIASAVEFTDTGLELDFRKLTTLCSNSKLPSRLCIVLEGPTDTSALEEEPALATSIQQHAGM